MENKKLQRIKEKLRKEWEAEDGCLDWNRVEDIFSEEIKNGK